MNAAILMALVLAQAPQTSAPASDAPSIKVGATIFTDYAVQQQPKTTDVDGNAVEASAFEVTRAYINLTGAISRRIAFRLTSDVARETGSGSSLNGSYTMRLKFAYLQWTLDDALRSRDTYVRFGIQPTPWVGYMDEIYRYRFQGQEFEERDGYLVSSDAAASMHYALPGDYGDVHTGFYNGEGYAKADPNGEKAWMTRGSVRPLPRHGVLHGLRVNGFYDRDAYAANAERRRENVSITFEHRYANAAFDSMRAVDRATRSAAAVHGRAWSAWVIPKSGRGWEGLFRIDRVTPNADVPAQVKKRTIAGIAYWFPPQGSVATALLLDVDNTTFAAATPSQPTQRKVALHAMLTF